MWAVGVTAYVLLSGFLPFQNETQSIFATYDFNDEEWTNVSQDAKNFIAALFKKPINERMTAAQAMSHPWLSGHAPATPVSARVRERMATYNAKRKLRAAAKCIILAHRSASSKSFGELRDSLVDSQLEFTPEQIDKLRENFQKGAAGGTKSLDKTGFATAFKESGLHIEGSTLDRMFTLFDMDGDGKVDYREFISGAASLSSATGSRMKLIFDLFDTDGNGSISPGELEAAMRSMSLATSLSSTGEAIKVSGELGKLFESIDTNGDGSISFDEFVTGAEKSPELKKHLIEPIDILTRNLSSSEP